MSNTEEIMEEDPWLKYTTYSSREEYLADLRGELGKSDEYEGPRECNFCIHYDGNHCTKDWNNMDGSYYIPDRDDKNGDDTCDDFELDEEVLHAFYEEGY